MLVGWLVTCGGGIGRGVGPVERGEGGSRDQGVLHQVQECVMERCWGTWITDLETSVGQGTKRGRDTPAHVHWAGDGVGVRRQEGGGQLRAGLWGAGEGWWCLKVGGASADNWLGASQACTILRGCITHPASS